MKRHFITFYRYLFLVENNLNITILLNMMNPDLQIISKTTKQRDEIIYTVMKSNIGMLKSNIAINLKMTRQILHHMSNFKW